jgi:hypothetical protein
VGDANDVLRPIYAERMQASPVLAALFAFDGTDEDATEAFQAALDAGYSGIRGTYRIRQPLTIYGKDQYISDPTPEHPDTGGVLGKLTATLLPYEG